ncbi:MAG: bi-domain-containing oxidoreductase [Anaerolineae bacterium]|nr:bi-domain-containing oxidoreductase [Anaerolineae bacterium]
MKQVLIKKGKAFIENVPAPLIEQGSVLVEVSHSLISVGTEMAGVRQSGKPLWQRAIEQPEQVSQLVDHLRRRGIQKTLAKIQDKRGSGSPTGYSCAGVVVQAGSHVTDLRPGQRVACAGAGKAVHAELVLVPQNLVVRVPEKCDLHDAASVTLGAIAMQGVRRADTRLGEIVAVIGLGLLGQLTVQLLKASGCRVIGIEPNMDRLALALSLGLDHGLQPSEVDVVTQIHYLTAGCGVDSTIITAASQSDAIVQQAMEITRKKGRVVVVGDVGLGLKRSPFYQKEIDFLISCSYGPGRYDPAYEERGLDYPYAYVRWTENRNMAEYLRLVATGHVNLKALIEQTYRVDNVDQAYQALNVPGARPLGVMLVYDSGSETQAKKQKTKITWSAHRAAGKINIALVGAGGFARATHLPNLQQLAKMYDLRAVMSATGSNATAAARQFGAEYATTSYADVLNDPNIEAILICTRHHLHAEQAAAAALAGKAVFLEKPMALNAQALGYLVGVLEQTRVPFMVGFNRRFSPAAQQARKILTQRVGPVMMMYRVNAGYLAPDHWTQTKEGGGRLIGEACHMFDLFQFLLSPARVVELMTSSLEPDAGHLLAGDNTVVTLKYDDGSVSTLMYTAMGANKLGKEYLEIHTGGQSLVIDDYRALRVFGAPAKGWEAKLQDKGHLGELQAFADYVQGNGPAPISLTDMIETTRISFTAAGVED